MKQHVQGKSPWEKFSPLPVRALGCLPFSCWAGSVQGMSTKAEAVLEQSQPVPLAAGTDGIIRVAGTRVTLDTVAEAFAQGATAEEIVQQYPGLALADVYSVLGHLLRNQAEVAEYLAGRDRQRADVQKENERRFAPNGVRARLLARCGLKAG